MPRSIIWLTLESIRTDHCTVTSSSAHKRDTTPGLRKLAAENDATAYESCFSHDIWTRSSSASILTGHAPASHQTWTNDARLPDAISTIPEAFQSAGYLTACVSGTGQLSPDTGLNRGFDHFHNLMINERILFNEVGVSGIAKWLWNIHQHSGGIINDAKHHCSGYLCNDLAKNYIDRAANSDESLFLYMHNVDSHHPYIPPVAWREQFAEDLSIPMEEAIELAIEMSDEKYRWIADNIPISDTEWETIQILYDTMIAYVDHLVMSLVSYARNALDDPIIVVTSDHGELFGEQGLLSHIIVANTAITNVPLVVSGLSSLPDDGLIQHADIMEIICSELNIDHPVPIGQDIRDKPREFAVTQRGGDRAETQINAITDHNESFPVSGFYHSDLTNVRTENWRYQTPNDLNDGDLFHLSDESSEVSDEYPEVEEQLANKCRSWQKQFAQLHGEKEAAELGSDIQDQLRDLGYLQ